MISDISVIIPTHAPHAERLARTLVGLRQQSLPLARWDLVVVDNRSPEPVSLDLSWHPTARVVREDRLGLTHARLAGGAAVRAPLLVFVDDDNVLGLVFLRRVADEGEEGGEEARDLVPGRKPERDRSPCT